jgi:hypothetical protein
MAALDERGVRGGCTGGVLQNRPRPERATTTLVSSCPLPPELVAGRSATT